MDTIDDGATNVNSAEVSLLTGAPVDSAAGRTRAQQRISLMTKRRKMSRRANVIGICAITCLCVLLLIATTQHRPLTAALSPMSGGMAGVGIGAGGGGVGGTNNIGGAAGSGMSSVSALGAERHTMASNMMLPSAIVYNLTATIAGVLAAQRAKIANEMEYFEYPAGRFGVDAEKLADLTPETQGMPVRSIVVTTWRSGSTFLGDILNAMPGNFYHYEPLLDFGIKQVRLPDVELAVNNLKKLLNCDFAEMDSYLSFGRGHTYLFEHNERLWANCKEYPHLCFREKFLTPFCKLFPLQSMKTVRLRLEHAEQLLQDNSLNVRIVLLVRDPRGTMQSRKHRVWCAGNPDCDDPEIVCEDLVADYQVAETLLKNYPSRFRTLRYEDLSLSPYDMTQEILQFYGLPFDPMVEEFLDTHTKVNIGGVSSTYRESRSAPFHWKQDLKIEEIMNIQHYCKKAMDLWGYRRIRNFTDYQRTFDPIILPPPLT